MSDHVEHLRSVLPDYICGVLWSLVIVVASSLAITPSQAALEVAAVAAILQPLALPEIASGFVVAVFGILLPYAVAVSFAPAIKFVTGKIYNRLYVRDEWYERATSEHVQLACTRVLNLVAIPPLKLGNGELAWMYLKHVGSPLVDGLRRQARTADTQIDAAFPFGALVGLTVYGLFRGWVGAGVAVVVSGAVCVLLLHAAFRRHQEWSEDVLLALLVATAPGVSSVEGDS